MKIVDVFINGNEYDKAIKELKEVIEDQPDYIAARIRLGQVYYEQKNVPKAIQEWESVLIRKPNHPVASKFLKQAQAIEMVDLTP